MLSLALALWASCLLSCANGVDDLQVIDADDAARSEPLGRSLEANPCSGPGASQAGRFVTEAFLAHARARGDDGGSEDWTVIDAKPDHRLRITNGCPFFYGMLFNETIRLSLVRPDDDNYLVAQWSRSPDNSCAEVVAELSWKTEPRDPTSQWPSNHSITSLCVDGQTTFSPLVESDAAAKSFYQKSSLGQGLPAHYGDEDPMHIDLQAIRSSYVKITGFWRFSFVNASHSGLREDQYAPMEKLFKNNCEPFRDSTGADRAGSEAFLQSPHSSAKLCKWMRFGWDEISRKRGSPLECALLEGVLCDDDGYITHIYLSDQGLQGRVDDATGLDHLTRLIVLDLKNNLLDGNLRTFVFGSPSLQILELSNNKFSGNIPDEIGNSDKSGWGHLVKLDLGHNRLSGSIPASFAALQLTSLKASSNDLRGCVPVAIFGLDKLLMLDLSVNQLSGTIPERIDGMSKLVSFDLSRNRLSGAIPGAIGIVTSMASFGLSTNMISGSIPIAFNSMRTLASLDLSTNRISGSIPSAFTSMRTLASLDLSKNGISGSIPMGITAMTKLVSLDLSKNRLSGSISGTVCASGENDMVQYSLLRQLRLSSNCLRGTIPSYCINELDVEGQASPRAFHQLPWQNIEELDLSLNRFSGTLPTFGNLTRLRTLRLAKNDFTQGTKSVDELLSVPHENHLQGPNAIVSLDRTLGELPQWVLDLRGRKAASCSCEMMPRPISINATNASPGEAVIVEVCNIWLAGPPRCKFFRESHEAITDARVLEPSYDGLLFRLECIVPESLHAILEIVNGSGNNWSLTVANFRSDFASELLLEKFHPPTVVLRQIDRQIGKAMQATAPPKPKRWFGVLHFIGCILVIILILSLIKIGHLVYIWRRETMSLKELQLASYGAFKDDELPGRTYI